MTLRIVTDAEIRRLPLSEKLFEYATSYVRGALALCEELAQSPHFTWADGAVVLMMSAHATELLLKAMLLKRMPEKNVWSLGHDLEKAWAAYCSHYPEPEFHWDIPFKTEYSPGTTQEQIAEFTRMSDASPSILFRYPVDRGGEDWRGLYGFEPNMFIPVLRRMRDEMARLRSVAV